MFTYKKYELLSNVKKLTAYQLYNYPIIIRYAAIQKFGVGILNVSSVLVHKLMIAYNVISLYEADKLKSDTRGKSSGSSLGHIPPPPMMMR